jgi:hypothetical protein
MSRVGSVKQVARKLTEDNLKVVWAEFSTLSLAFLLCVQLHDLYKYGQVYSGKLGPGFVLLACLSLSTIEKIFYFDHSN